MVALGNRREVTFSLLAVGFPAGKAGWTHWKLQVSEMTHISTRRKKICREGVWGETNKHTAEATEFDFCHLRKSSFLVGVLE